MPWFSRKYYHEEDTPTGYRNLESGYALLMHNPLFQQLEGIILTKASHLNEKGSIACVFKNGTIHVNTNIILSPEQWYYVLAHNLLHLAFGHFDQDHIHLIWNSSQNFGIKPVIFTLPDFFTISASVIRSVQIRHQIIP